MSGSIERIDESTVACEMDHACRDLLKLIIQRVGHRHLPSPISLDDPTWVSYRLAEILPLDMRIKQELLELQDTGERLQRLRQVLVKEGLIAV